MASIFDGLINFASDFPNRVTTLGSNLADIPQAMAQAAYETTPAGQLEKQKRELAQQNSILAGILKNPNLSQQQQLEALSQASPEFMQKRLELMLQPPKPLNAPNVMLDKEGNPMMTQYDPNDGSLYINGQKVGGGQGRQVPIMPSYGAGVMQQGGTQPMPQGGQNPNVQVTDLPPVGRGAYAEEMGKGIAKNTLEATKELQKNLDLAQQSLTYIENLKNHKGLSDAVGAKSLLGGMITHYNPLAAKDPYGQAIPIAGTNAADFMAQLNQVKGGAFLEAYQMLKGGGHITEVEGAKAEAAIARLDASQTEAEFKKALSDYESVIKAGVARAQKAAGITPAPVKPSGAITAEQARAELARRRAAQ